MKIKFKLIFGIGLPVTEKRLKNLGFKKKNFIFDTKPRKVWVLGNHMTDTGSFADTIMYDPNKNRITASYGGNISIPTYSLVESTWDINQFLKKHSYADEKTLHEEKYGVKDVMWKLILKSHGEYKIKVMKELKSMFGLTLHETKAIVDSLPQKISTEYFKSEAIKKKNQLESIGADVEIQ